MAKLALKAAEILTATSNFGVSTYRILIRRVIAERADCVLELNGILTLVQLHQLLERLHRLLPFLLQ